MKKKKRRRSEEVRMRERVGKEERWAGGDWTLRYQYGGWEKWPRPGGGTIVVVKLHYPIGV